MSVIVLIATSLAIAAQPTKRPSDAERGQQLWEQSCSACHGPSNRGDGPATTALVAPVPDLRDEVKVNEATIKVVLRGQGAMPGYETSFDKADARRVLKYMATVHNKKTTAPKAPPVAPTNDEDEADDAQGEPDEP